MIRRCSPPHVREYATGARALSHSVLIQIRIFRSASIEADFLLSLGSLRFLKEELGSNSNSDFKVRLSRGGYFFALVLLSAF